MFFSRNRKQPRAEASGNAPIARPSRTALSKLLVAAVGASALFAGACQYKDPDPFTEGKVFAGGVEVTAKTLNDGRDAYMLYCYACHGEKGDGTGPASYGLRPPPRDFTKGIFKFARLRSSDELPNDDDLVRIVKGGLHGTAMLAWDIPEVELRMVLQYVKTFAPQKWEKKKKSGEPVKTLEPWAPEADPWTGKEAEAIKAGETLYHLRAECLNCHPSFLGKKDLYELSVEAAKKNPDKFKAISGFRTDPNGSVAKDSPEYGVKIMPPDFTFHQVRSATSENPTQDLYRIISFGVYPIMPAWKGAGLTDDEIWALAHYVKSLMDLRGTKAADELQKKYAAQVSFEPPAAAPEPAPADPAAAEEKPADGAAPADADKKGDKKDEKKGEKKGDKK